MSSRALPHITAMPLALRSNASTRSHLCSSVVQLKTHVWIAGPQCSIDEYHGRPSRGLGRQRDQRPSWASEYPSDGTENKLDELGSASLDLPMPIRSVKNREEDHGRQKLTGQYGVHPLHAKCWHCIHEATLFILRQWQHRQSPLN